MSIIFLEIVINSYKFTNKLSRKQKFTLTQGRHPIPHNDCNVEFRNARDTRLRHSLIILEQAVYMLLNNDVCKIEPCRGKR